MNRLITEPEDAVKQPPNPRSTANVLQILTFSWMFNLFKLGRKRELEEKDLYASLRIHSSSLLGDELESIWYEEVSQAGKVGRTPSLRRALTIMFGSKYMMHGFVQFCNEIILRVSQPLLIGGLLTYFKIECPDGPGHAYVCAVCLVLGLLFSVFMHHPNQVEVSHCGMQMRVACGSLIYRKALRVSNMAFGETTVGQVINLLSSDVNRFDVSLLYIHYLWIGPLQMILLTYFLWRLTGMSSLIGMSTFFIFIPLQALLGKRISRIRTTTAQKTDERVRLMQEIISGIQLIKMYTWEKPFAKIIEFARQKEILFVEKLLYTRAFLSSFTLLHTKVQLFIIIATYVMLGNEVTIEKIFVIISFYSIMGDTMTIVFCLSVVNMVEILVSIERIEKFLLLDERELLMLDDPSANVPNNGVFKEKYIKKATSFDRDMNRLDGICVSNATARWTSAQDTNTLENVNLIVEPGRLAAVVGPIGSGKSSLLQAMLRELPLIEGSISIGGVVSYAAQEPWLFSGSVKQNILFDSPMDRYRYKQVIKVCALKNDIDQFPYGDRTIVGEKGVILSGGQRARINLARAIYKRADVYLLDDPLSAVDTKVGKHLFDKCIRGFLKDKICVLVTHQIQYLVNVDQIVVMNKGNVVVQGSYREVQARGIDFGKLHDSSSWPMLMSAVEASNAHAEGVDGNKLSQSSTDSFSSSVVRATNANNVALPRPVEEREIRSTGHVSKSVYKSYFAASGKWFRVMLLIFMYSLTQLLNTGGDYWISIWVTEEENLRHRGNITVDRLTMLSRDLHDAYMPTLDLRQSFVVVYSFFTMSFVVAILISSSLFVSVCVRSSENLHNNMFNAVSRASMYFFNTNPSGRVINRFSKDIGAIDEMVPSIILDFLRVIMIIIGVFLVVGLVNAYLLIPSLVATAIFYFMITFYLKTSRSVKRLEGITRSPVFSHMNESIQGLTTIRAFDAEKMLHREFDKHQDLHSSAWYTFISCNNAFAFWVDLVCLAYIAFVIFSFFFFSDDVKAQGGLFGLALIQTIRTVGVVQIGIKQYAMLENQMTSVERVLEYTNSPQELIDTADDTPDETPADTPTTDATVDTTTDTTVDITTDTTVDITTDDTTVDITTDTTPEGLPAADAADADAADAADADAADADAADTDADADAADADAEEKVVWPSLGEIMFENFNMRYKEDGQCILKDLNFQIRSKEKIGIVGRTGAGKSSIAKALFRLAFNEGDIFVDGVNIDDLGLTALRSAISIIPQEPVLFSGTLRTNLDPFNQYTDPDLWDVLEMVELKEMVRVLPGGLSLKMSQNGSNMSVGQRQLVCLARAIVRGNKILVLDEATANVDTHTDTLIQKTIREAFKNCTVLTIAHRLMTIMDSDRVLVMDAGAVVEFDHPHNLLQDERGFLYSMVKETGPETADSLRAVAAESFKNMQTRDDMSLAEDGIAPNVRL